MILPTASSYIISMDGGKKYHIFQVQIFDTGPGAGDPESSEVFHLLVVTPHTLQHLLLRSNGELEVALLENTRWIQSICPSFWPSSHDAWGKALPNVATQQFLRLQLTVLGTFFSSRWSSDYKNPLFLPANVGNPFIQVTGVCTVKLKVWIQTQLMTHLESCYSHT